MTGRRAAAALLAAVAWLVPQALTAAPPAAAEPAAVATAAATSARSVPWDERGTLVLSASAALTALSNLPADDPASVSWGAGGSRTGWFGEAWEDVDGDGCDTRNEILGRDLVDADYSRRAGRQTRTEGRGEGVSSCRDATVWSGTLHDPYTGSTVAFKRGAGTSAKVQIDHVVPLNYLYAHGAWRWSARTRLLIANDPLNLVAVDGEANEDKSNCGPATCPMGSTETKTWETAAGKGWWPPRKAYRCDYARRFTTVLATYRLGVPEKDRAALRTALASCAQGGDGSTDAVSQALPAARSAWNAILGSRPLALACAAGAALLGIGVLARARRR